MINGASDFRLSAAILIDCRWLISSALGPPIIGQLLYHLTCNNYSTHMNYKPASSRPFPLLIGKLSSKPQCR